MITKKDGYLIVRLPMSNRWRTRSVHQLVALAFLGPCPHHKEVNHINGQKQDIRPENLEYVTASENIRHAFRTGLRTFRGSRHPRATLTEEDVRCIRAIPRTVKANIAWHREKLAIAARFHTTLRVIETVRNRQNWKHVA